MRCRQNLADALRQDEKVDRKIARNQNQFEALDFNAAVADTRMSPASAFVATIRGRTWVTPPVLRPQLGCEFDMTVRLL